MEKVHTTFDIIVKIEKRKEEKRKKKRKKKKKNKGGKKRETSKNIKLSRFKKIEIIIDGTIRKRIRKLS
jgi:hypothetical protein